MPAEHRRPMQSMPFGKYKGQPFNQIPDDYIRYVLEKFDNLREPLKSTLERELAARNRNAPPWSVPSPLKPELVRSTLGVTAAQMRAIIREELHAFFKGREIPGGSDDPPFPEEPPDIS